MGMKKGLFFIGCLSGLDIGVLIILTFQHVVQDSKVAKGRGFGAAAEWNSFSMYERIVT